MTRDVDQKGSPSATERWSLFRDVSLFVGGFLGAAHETVLTTLERPTLLILYAAMMGLPAFLPNGKH